MYINQTIHDAATDLVCSVSKTSTSIWVCIFVSVPVVDPSKRLCIRQFFTSTYGESDARDIIESVLLIRDTFLKILGFMTVNESIIDSPLPPGTQAWSHKVFLFNTSTTVFMHGVAH